MSVGKYIDYGAFKTLDPRWTGSDPGRRASGVTPDRGYAGTITPPTPVEPAPEPHPADHRLYDAERCLMAERRQLLNALDWNNRALTQVRKARGQ